MWAASCARCSTDAPGLGEASTSVAAYAFAVAGRRRRAYRPITMIDVIKKTLLAGVGAAIVTKEKVEGALGDFVKQGKVSAEEARAMAAKIADQGRQEFEEASQNLSAKIKELLKRTDEQTQARLAALEARVTDLESKLADRAQGD